MINIRAIGGVLVALAAAGLAWYVMHLRAENTRLETENLTLSTDLTACQEDQQIAYEVSNEYQRSLADVSAKLATFKRLRSSCIVPRRNPTGGPHAATDNGVNAGPDARGLSTDWLYDFAGECEGYRLQVIGLQSFVNKTVRDRPK